MSSKSSNLEFLSYIEPHLSQIICEFLIKQGDKSAELKKIYEDALKKCEDYELMVKNGLLPKDQLAKKKEELTKKEEELKEKLHGFLNLCSNCQKINNYDINSFPLGKKIVSKIKFIFFLNLFLINILLLFYY